MPGGDECSHPQAALLSSSPTITHSSPLHLRVHEDEAALRHVEHVEGDEARGDGRGDGRAAEAAREEVDDEHARD